MKPASLSQPEPATPEIVPPGGDARPDPAPPEHVLGDCQRANDVIALTGTKWSVQIVMLLSSGTHRFSEIRRAVSGISQKMLTVTLRALERDGYVARTFHPTIPPRVDYHLTPLGSDLAVPLRALGAWALLNHDRVLIARADFDARNPPTPD